MMVNDYSQKKRNNIMLCYPMDFDRLKKWGFPIFVQPKLDGNRCRYSAADQCLYSSTSEVITSVPHINEALLHLPFNIHLDGELYIHGIDHNEINSIVSRTVNISEDFESMEYHIFDLITDEPQYLRLKDLYKLKEDLKSDKIKFVETKLVKNFEELEIEYFNYLEKGYEGIILRYPANYYTTKRSTWLMKYKPKKFDYYNIIGFEEEVDKHGNLKNGLGSLICSGFDSESFGVGSGFTRDQREKLWKVREELIGKFCKVGYQSISSKNKVPRFSTFIEIVDL